MEKGRERCWKAFLDSVFDYSDSSPPRHGLSVCDGRVQGADVNAGWLHNRRQVGNNPGPQLPCCPYLFFFIHVANCQALYLPGQSHSCVGGPQHSCAGDLLGQLGLRCPLGTPRLAAAVIRCGHRCVPGPGKPGQAANGARGADCSTAAVSQPRGLRAWHSWVTLHPALGGQPAVGWHGSQGRESAASSWNLLKGISKRLAWSRQQFGFCSQVQAVMRSFWKS